jgi:hypothetical protein
MEELRRERAQMSAARDARPLCPRPCGRQRRFVQFVKGSAKELASAKA